jgi:hypothetical protein
LLRSVGVGVVVLVALFASFTLLRPASEDRPLFEILVAVGVALAVFVPATFLLKPRGFEPAIARLRQGARRRGRTMAG